MDINIKTTNISLTPDLREYLDKRMKTFDKLIDPEDTSVLCNVEVGRTSKHHQHGDIFRAEVNLHTASGNFYAASENPTVFIAIDEVQKQILKELRRGRSRRHALMRKGSQQVKDFLLGVSGRFRRRK